MRRNTERQTGECWSWRRGRAGGPAGAHCRARHRTAHAHAPPGWLLRLSVLDQTRPTSSKPRSCTSPATLRAGCGQAGHPQRSPAPNGQTGVPAGTEAPAHEAHGPSSRGGLGGAHAHPGPSLRPRGPRHTGHAVPGTQAIQSPSRRHTVPVILTIQFVSGAAGTAPCGQVPGPPTNTKGRQETPAAAVAGRTAAPGARSRRPSCRGSLSRHRADPTLLPCVNPTVPRPLPSIH